MFIFLDYREAEEKEEDADFREAIAEPGHIWVLGLNTGHPKQLSWFRVWIQKRVSGGFPKCFKNCRRHHRP